MHSNKKKSCAFERQERDLLHREEIKGVAKLIYNCIIEYVSTRKTFTQKEDGQEEYTELYQNQERWSFIWLLNGFLGAISRPQNRGSFVPRGKSLLQKDLLWIDYNKYLIRSVMIFASCIYMPSVHTCYTIKHTPGIWESGLSTFVADLYFLELPWIPTYWRFKEK